MDELEKDARGVYAALLASLGRDVLHPHCADFMHTHLANTQQSVAAAAAALHRVREVTRAAQKLQSQSSNDSPHHLQLKAVSKLRRRLARALRRLDKGCLAAMNGRDAGAERRAVARAAVEEQPAAQVAAAAFSLDETAPVSPLLQHPQEQPQQLCTLEGTASAKTQSESSHDDTSVFAEKQEEPESLHEAFSFPAAEMEPPPEQDSTLESSEQRVPEQTGEMVKAPQSTGKRPRENAWGNGASCDASLPLDLETKPKAWELWEALRKLDELNPSADFVALVQREIRVPDDFASSSLASQVDAICALSAGIKALSSNSICKNGSELAQKQRRMVAAVIAEAVQFYTTFMVAKESTSEPQVDASELFGMLECIGSAKGVFRDLKPILGRLRQSELELTAYLQNTNESEFLEWDTERKLTGSKRREFENIRETLESWIENEKCRGSALDQLMHQFERLLAKSLALWDVAKDDAVRACVDRMAAVATNVDGSIEKSAARIAKLNAFRNILSNDGPLSARAVRARNKGIPRR